MRKNDTTLETARRNTGKLEAVRTATIMGRAKDHFGIMISADAQRHWIRNIESVKSLLGLLTEAERAAVAPATLAEWNADLEADPAP
jgi:hypothetical protein